MQIAGILKNSVVNGEGIRDVVFLQGCSHHCKGCHNPHTWNPEGGRYVSANDIINELRESPNPVTISGGEPLEQFLLVHFLIYSLNRRQGKTTWLYTGYRFDEIDRKIWQKLSKAGVVVVVDGRYEEDKKDLALQFRGSSNQRLIDLRKTLDQGQVVLWEG